jgi:peptidoglycan/LPS O-acetylase OafA/YrhL
VPFIIRYCDPRKLPWLLLSFVLVAPFLRVALFFWDPLFLSAYVLMPCRADALLLGVLAAWMVRQKSQFLGNHSKMLLVTLGILLAGVIALIITGNILAWSPGMVTFGYSWLALFYTCFLLQAVTQKRGIIKAIASNSLLGRLGIIAYGVYVFHQGMLGLTHTLILNQTPKIQGIQELGVTLLALAITLAGASASWRFFEKPLVLLGHAFHYGKTVPSMLPSSLKPQPSEARAG